MITIYDDDVNRKIRACKIKCVNRAYISNVTKTYYVDNNNPTAYKLPIIHYAEVVGQTDAIAELIRHGADFNVKNKNGKTPVQLLLERRKNLFDSTPTPRNHEERLYYDGTNDALDELDRGIQKIKKAIEHRIKTSQTTPEEKLDHAKSLALIDTQLPPKEDSTLIANAESAPTRVQGGLPKVASGATAHLGA